MKDKKVVFMGTPTFAVPILKYLIEATNVVLVVSQPNREKDRKGNLIDTLFISRYNHTWCSFRFYSSYN